MLEPVTEPTVEVIIPSYNGKDLLAECLPSVLAQTYPKIQVTVVDDASVDGTVEYLAQTFRSITVMENSERMNFARSTNRALRESHADFVLVLNNDTALEPNCVEELVKAACATNQIDERAVGFAPKMILDRFNRAFLDAVGTSIATDGSSFNNGIGQIDLGQFDTPMRVFGLCWGAAFLRTAAFREIGYLDDSYVAYYEDVDWNYRANVLGYTIYTAPKARVYHKHSATWRRTADYESKYYLIHRNFLRTVAKNYYRGQLIWLVRRVSTHLLNVYSSARHGRFNRAESQLKILVDTLIMLPKLLAQNIALNRRRRVWDSQIWNLSSPRIISMSPGTFDPATYSPVLTIDVIEELYRENLSQAVKDALKTDAITIDEREQDYLEMLVLQAYVKGQFSHRPHAKPYQVPRSQDTNDGSFFLSDLLATRESWGYIIHNKDGTLFTDKVLYRILVACHGRNIEQIAEKILLWLCPQTVSPRLVTAKQVLARSIENAVHILVRAGLVQETLHER
jgi:GT2 family glycosyltransferase